MKLLQVLSAARIIRLSYEVAPSAYAQVPVDLSYQAIRMHASYYAVISKLYVCLCSVAFETLKLISLTWLLADRLKLQFQQN